MALRDDRAMGERAWGGGGDLDEAWVSGRRLLTNGGGHGGDMIVVLIAVDVETITSVVHVFMLIRSGNGDYRGQS